MSHKAMFGGIFGTRHRFIDHSILLSIGGQLMY
jgi:hypothetical protein